MECAGDRWAQTSQQATQPQVCVLTASELRNSQALALPTLGTEVMPARAVAATQNGSAGTSTATAGLDAPSSCAFLSPGDELSGGTGEGCFTPGHQPAATQTVPGWEQGQHCSPRAAGSPSPDEAAVWGCSALVLPPPLLAVLHRVLQVGPELQEPPWMCHILDTLSLLEGPQYAMGLSHQPQTTQVPGKGQLGTSPSPAWGSTTVLWCWHCSSPWQGLPVPVGDAEPGLLEQPSRTTQARGVSSSSTCPHHCLQQIGRAHV